MGATPFTASCELLLYGLLRYEPTGLRIRQPLFNERGVMVMQFEVLIDSLVQQKGTVSFLGIGQKIDAVNLAGERAKADGLECHCPVV